MNKFILFSALLSIAGIAQAAPLPPSQGRTDLAFGKKVLFSPAPNYSLTAKGDTDSLDLTDGTISKREDQRIWFDSAAVGWSYPGRVNLAVDLGQQCDIDEVAIRFQNGSSTGGRSFPGWVEAFVSQDGEHYTKVAEFSQWNADDFKKYNIGQERGTSWVDALRFTDLKAHGRWVGLRFYGNAMTVSDEMYVFGKSNAAAPALIGESDDFSVKSPEVYFHKPYLKLANNASLPVPIGINIPDNGAADVSLSLDVPKEWKLSGSIGGIDVTKLQPKVLLDGFDQYTFEAKSAKANKVFGRLYMEATNWKDRQSGELRYRISSGDWQSPQMSVPVRVVNIPAAPRLQKVMASMGWWPGASEMAKWPTELADFRTIGLNTFNVFGMWMPKDTADPAWASLEQARKEGFFISNIDSPLSPILTRHKNEKEIYDQLGDGKVSNKLSISYRGKYYQEEIQRFAQMMAKVKPDFSSEDIELWSWRGPTDSMNDERNQADYAKSGASSWAQWQQSKGSEMISDLILSAQKAVQDAGGKPFKTGMYDVRPGGVYQQLFDFDALYPKILNDSQVSTYTSLQPADIAFIGDEAREDRARLPQSDVMPWLTPGDAGVFPGSNFEWALLECYTNGARGIWFWSSRMWDSEDLIAYNKVLRAIAPVEEVIVNGDLIGSAATIQGAGRVSGMKLGSKMVLLAADYFGKSDGTLQLQLNLPAKSTLRDLMSDEVVEVLLPGKQTVSIPLNGQSARLLEVVPQ